MAKIKGCRFFDRHPFYKVVITLLLLLEEYIAKRKRKDKLNEFDLENKEKNIQASMSYIFDYYYKYLNQSEKTVTTAKHQKSSERYKTILEKRYVDPEINTWLMNIFNEYDKQIDLSIKHFLEEQEEFSLCCSDNDFKAITTKLINETRYRIPFLYLYESNVCQMAKMIYNMKIGFEYDDLSPYERLPRICEWVSKTFENYSVDLFQFVYQCYFHLPPSEYRKLKINFKHPFSIDIMYEKYKEKPFIYNRKKELEILFMLVLYEITQNNSLMRIYIDSLEEQ